ncbi:hypothetical protein VNI00_009322 [Paramarasmius palmivorus]|uniref:Protein kinase domain-containing protein n=1 Tax=Paramarasmius palmivorus TaxID=297713 RepID=A0AAW0CR32_9AGAR
MMHSSSKLSYQALNIRNVEELQEVLVSPDPVRKLLSVDAACVPAVVELLQSEIITISAPHDQYRRLRMKCLRALVKKFQTLPSSMFLRNIECLGEHPLGGGAFSDIWKGLVGQQSICLKVIRLHIEGDTLKREKIYATFCQEALLWTHLRHDNVLPFLGVNTELFLSRLCLISPWMANGDIISFLRRNPHHDRLRSICEISAGLEYLHSVEVVHGDIKGVNILVDDTFQCRLADFGLAAATSDTQITTSNSGTIKGSLRWMAPEVFMGVQSGTERNKYPRDVYSYACTVYEIMTEQPPFHGLLEAALIYHLMVLKARPERPVDGWCPDNVWNLVERSWAEDPQQRPRSDQVHTYLKELLRIRDSGDISKPELVLEQAPRSIDDTRRDVEELKMPIETDGSAILSESPYITSEGAHSPLLMPSVPLKWTLGKLLHEDRSGRTYRATTIDGQLITVTEAEIPGMDASYDQQSAIKMLRNQDKLLRRLNHPNIVHCFGLKETPLTLSLALEYLPTTIAGHLERHGKLDDENVKHFTAQIVAGLEYLHSEGILHRNLKGRSILVDDDGSCKIADFGISKRIVDSLGTRTPPPGPVFWTAPEVAYNRGVGYDYKADIWSLGCIVLEMLSGTRPWAQHEDFDVTLKLLRERDTPPIPSDVVLSELADAFIKWCFAIDPQARPTAEMLREHHYLTLPAGWSYQGPNVNLALTYELALHGISNLEIHIASFEMCRGSTFTGNATGNKDMSQIFFYLYKGVTNMHAFYDLGTDAMLHPPGSSGATRAIENLDMLIASLKGQSMSNLSRIVKKSIGHLSPNVAVVDILFRPRWMLANSWDTNSPSCLTRSVLRRISLGWVM